MGVALRHNEAVLGSLEKVSFVKHILIAAGVVALPLHVDVRPPFVHPAKSSCHLLVGVHINDQGKPEGVDLVQGKSIEVGGRLQIVVSRPIVLPLKADPELQLDGVVVFFDGNNLVQGQ